MRNQWLFRSMVILALLLCLSMAACQPITAPVAQAASKTTTEEINKAALRDWFDAINTHDLNRIDLAVDKYYAPDYVLHDPTVPNYSGGAATNKKLIREAMQALPDLHVTVEEMVAEGDWVAIRSTVTGTQPDGKPLNFFTLNMLRFVDGQMADEWELVEPAGEEVAGSDIGNK